MSRGTSRRTTRALIAPILRKAYGKGSMVDSLAEYLAQRIDTYPVDPIEESRGREYMVMRVCWDWMTGGSTAESVAGRIETALNGGGS